MASLRRAEADAEEHGLACERCGRHASVEDVDAHFDQLWIERKWRPWVCAGCRN